MITASHLYSFLVCPHRVTMDAHADPAKREDVSAFVQLLWERGSRFERETVSKITTTFTDLSALSGEAKELATRVAMARGDALIYGGRLSADDLLGEPDLLRREATQADGRALYVAIDIKSGRGSMGESTEGEDPKPKSHYGVQLALYTDLLIRSNYSAGRYAFIWDVHGAEVRYDLDNPLNSRSTETLWSLYLEARRDVAAALARPDATRPAAASDCGLCVWRSACLETLKSADDLTLLPELGRAAREDLSSEFPTLHELAAANLQRYIHKGKSTIRGVGADRLRTFQARAQLAVAKNPRPYLKRALTLPTATREIFFDIETDPMRDLCYLRGFLVREGRDNARETFTPFFAEDTTPEAERDAFTRAWAFLNQDPGAAVYIYSRFERTTYRKLAARYGLATEAEVDAVFAPPRTTDLYHDIVRSGTEWPTLGYGIKPIAKWLGFQWRDANPSGAASIEWFHRYAETRDAPLKQRILDYNEDDCRAMRVLVDALATMEVRVTR